MYCNKICPNICVGNSTCSKDGTCKNPIIRELVNSNKCSRNSSSTVKDFDKCQYQKPNKSWDYGEKITCPTKITRGNKTTNFSYKGVTAQSLTKKINYIQNLCAKICPTGTTAVGEYKLFCEYNSV